MRHSIPLERLQDLAPTLQGLSQEQVQARRRWGDNDIVEVPPHGSWASLRETLRDPMLWFLLATAALFGALGDWVEASTLLVAMLPLIGMDAYLHRRTRASTEGLSSRLATRAWVQRDGQWRELPARELVPGDLARVGAAEYFPADGLLQAGSDMLADESTLSGESLPVRKHALGEGTWPASVSPECWASAGTRLLTGQALLRVVCTGRDTQYGAIVRSALAGRQARTPLQLAIANLVAALLVLALAMCLVLAGIRLQQGHGLADAVLSAVTLAVAALPEEYPVVFTFFLGAGVFRLARRQALVRRAVAVENIGRVSCICCDKTGTITAGTLALAHSLPAGGHDEAALHVLAARAARDDSQDPLDTALLAGSPPAARGGDRLEVYPYTEQRRRETAIWRIDGGELLAVCKGAPETLLAQCELAPEAIASWRARVEQYAQSGHKVIACASRRLSAGAWPGGEPDRGYTLAGLLAFEDPVREGVADAVAECRQAGIRVVMVTGDHPSTALAVAREIGLGAGQPKVVVPEPGEEGTAVADDVDVVARAVPAQKLELVRALQSRGEIVAVTGDGVNDVPALQAADVGIAMGERGTRSARETAAIVLLDDNFRTIVRAVAEGRQLFRNLQLSFAYLLMVHIPLVVSAAAVPLAGVPLLYLPVHVVWIELLIHPTALLVFQQQAGGSRLQPRPREATLRFFSRGAWLGIAAVGAALSAMVVWGYDLALGTGHDVEHARALAMATLLMGSASITAGLSGMRTAAAWAMVLASLVSLALFIQLPGVAALLHLRPLHAADWAVAAASGLWAGLAALALRRLMARGGRPAHSHAQPAQRG